MISRIAGKRILPQVSRHLLQIELEAAAQSSITWPILFFSMAGSSLLAIALGQDTSFDVRNYHFYAGFAILHKPLNFDFAPAQVQSFFNPLMHIITYLLLVHLPSRMAAAILGAIQGLNFYLLFRISILLFRRWRNPYRYLLSLSNAAAGFFGAANLSELGTSFGDNLATLLILTGILLLLRHTLPENVAAGNSVSLLCIAGVVIGTAAGLKLTTSIYGLAVAIAFTGAYLFRALGRMRPLVAFYACAAAGFIAAYGFWGTSLYLEYRNPVFPYFNGIFLSPHYDAENTMDPRFLPRDLRQKFFFPFYFLRKNQFASEVTYRDARLALCYIAVALLVGATIFRVLTRKSDSRFWRSTEHEVCALIWALFFAVSYVGWQHFFSIYRYALLLELLAPTFLALVLTSLAGRRLYVLAGSLALNLFITGTVVPLNFGRQRFDDEYLRVRVPPIPELEKSVVLMAGDEATSFIIPGFPPGTRFVRVSGNFTYPGRSANLDRKIRRMLEPYDSAHTFVYVTEAREMKSTLRDVSFYGVTFDRGSCLEVTTRAGSPGFLCRKTPESKSPEEKPSQPGHASPATESVWLEVTPHEVIAGRDILEYRVFGLKARAIDVLYLVDGEEMPPVKDWHLNNQYCARVFVSADTRKGLYHIARIRTSGAGKPAKWIKVDASTRIR